MARKASDLKAQVLLAALDCSNGDLQQIFTFEDLLVRAWQRDPISWGLRGFERDHPDSERIHRELDSRGNASKGLVELGLLERVRSRVYRLTPKGLAAASDLRPDDAIFREKVDRSLEGEIRKIIEHPVFSEWLKDPSKPRHFRDAGRFWGIAPGTPPRVIQERIRRVEQTLEAALDTLERKGVQEVGVPRGGLLFDRTDIERCRQCHEALKQRFGADLRVLGAEVV